MAFALRPDRNLTNLAALSRPWAASPQAVEWFADARATCSPQSPITDPISTGPFAHYGVNSAASSA
jgi:hypothetical protein